MQNATPAQDSDIGEMPPNWGNVCNAQEVPFQSSAWPPAGPEPIASQKIEETQDTARSAALGGPDWLCWRGVGCRTHDVPFHISARSALLPELPVYEPTASQKLADAHDTDLRELSVAPPGSTARCSRQDLPFQASASACGVLAVVFTW